MCKEEHMHLICTNMGIFYKKLDEEAEAKFRLTTSNDHYFFSNK